MLANPRKEPTLEEMTKFAVQALKKDPNGFFLFVEGKYIFLLAHFLFLAEKEPIRSQWWWLDMSNYVSERPLFSF